LWERKNLIWKEKQSMVVKAKIEAPRGQTQRHARRVSLYQERNTPVRVAADRTSRINAAIVEILSASVKFSPELAHRLHQDAE
jgi:hypothetical protein